MLHSSVHVRVFVLVCGIIIVFGCLSVSPTPDLHLSEAETAGAWADPPADLMVSSSTCQNHGNGYNYKSRTKHCRKMLQNADPCYPLFSMTKLK